MKRASSMLVVGVPLQRGNPDHIEHQDDVARTDFDQRGKVTAIHTPQDALVRVHELMHARHTVAKRFKNQYKNVCNTVAQITEDVRLHQVCWPWRFGATPKSIVKSAKKYLASEKADMDKMLAEHPEAKGTWPEFATRLRQCAVNYGLCGATGPAAFANDAQLNLAMDVLNHCRKRREGRAAELLQAAFFPPIEVPVVPGKKPRLGKSGRKPGSGNAKATMEIIELPHSEHIAEATVGHRLATSGSRLYRPALRRPILPQRMFIRRAAVEPGGTILVDASGSMGDFGEITKWCEKAPFGTIAYYAGSSHEGELYVYARNGKRAADIVYPKCGRNNVVDGPALDWLMQQPAPRTIVTDRQFCGAWDSDAQIVRLGNLERNGDVKVVNYAKEDE